MQNDAPSIFWFRQDLRLADNPGLTHAISIGKILAVYILDDTHPGDHAMGAATKVWTHHSLSSLNTALNGALNFYKGDPEKIIPDLVKRHNTRAVTWNRCYEPWRVARDTRIKDQLKKNNVHVESFNAALLWEPWAVLKQDGTPYKVFTPFYQRGCLSARAPRTPLPAPPDIPTIKDTAALPLDALGLLPKIPWDQKFIRHWDISEPGAQKQLQEFLTHGLAGYKEGRNFPSKPHISRLSPYLHSGEISPNQIWHAARMQGDTPDIDCFCTELGWREFSYSLLHHFPSLPHENWQKKFDKFPWIDNPDHLKKWQTGMTGFPIVDAGMRELWQTGYMHNRVRMIVASFLIKNLLIDWRKGAKWFWDCLVDADLASNSASWQWVAGSGADAAPYFRIFNPVGQSEKFDPDGSYIRHYVPELSKLPTPHLFTPWDAPENILKQAGIKLGETYPFPIVDLGATRTRALEAYGQLKMIESR